MGGGECGWLTLSPSSPGGPWGPAGPGRPTGPWTPSRPAGPWGPFSPYKNKTMCSNDVFKTRNDGTGQLLCSLSAAGQTKTNLLGLLSLQQDLEAPEDQVYQTGRLVQLHQQDLSRQASPIRVGETMSESTKNRFHVLFILKRTKKLNFKHSNLWVDLFVHLLIKTQRLLLLIRTFPLTSTKIIYECKTSVLEQREMQKNSYL